MTKDPEPRPGLEAQDPRLGDENILRLFNLSRALYGPDGVDMLLDPLPVPEEVRAILPDEVRRQIDEAPSIDGWEPNRAETRIELERLRAEAGPLEDYLPSDREVGRLTGRVQRSLRRAAQPLEAEGWIARSSSVMIRDAAGNSGHIGLERMEWGRPLPFEFRAGTRSAYLTRVWRREDPERAPSVRNLVFDADVIWGIRFHIAELGAPPPFEPLVVPEDPIIPDYPERTIIGPVVDATTAEEWLRTTLGTLADSVASLLGDEAILAWLTRQRHYAELRKAVLLARHLGRDAQSADLLRAAGDAFHASLDIYNDLGGRVPRNARDRRFEPDIWTHERFVHFLDKAEP